MAEPTRALHRIRAGSYLPQHLTCQALLTALTAGFDSLVGWLIAAYMLVATILVFEVVVTAGEDQSVRYWDGTYSFRD